MTRLARRTRSGLLDVLALPALLGLAVQRLGCLLAGMIGPGAATSLAVHPTQVYEAALFLVLAAVLRRTRTGSRVPGGVALACVVGYAPLGFATEFLRAHSPAVFGSPTIIQLQCVAVFAAGLAVWRRTSPMESDRVLVEAGGGRAGVRPLSPQPVRPAYCCGDSGVPTITLQAGAGRSDPRGLPPGMQ